MESTVISFCFITLFESVDASANYGECRNLELIWRKSVRYQA